MTAPLGDIAHVLRRIADDPTFLGQLRSDPKSALSRYELSHADLARIDLVVSSLAPLSDDD